MSVVMPVCLYCMVTCKRWCFFAVAMCKKSMWTFKSMQFSHWDGEKGKYSICCWIILNVIKVITIKCFSHLALWSRIEFTQGVS